MSNTSTRCGLVMLALLVGTVGLLRAHGTAQSKASAAVAQPVIIDTDIGDDIDDAFAVGLALESPELKMLGITAAWGDTGLRARLLDRLLTETHHAEIPVAVGIEKHGPGAGVFSQANWARVQPARPHPDAVSFLLEQIRAHPDQITLIAIAPLTNIAAAIDRDPATFHRLKRIVMMGGSIHRGYDDLDYLPARGPSAEYNIAMDPAAAQKVFAAGVPIYVMPLDATQLKLDEGMRGLLFTQSTPLTDALALLYDHWSRSTRQETPTMFDAVAVAYAIDPTLCPTQPMHLQVDAEGYTRPQAGTPNAQVCLSSDSDQFFRFYLPRLLAEPRAP